MLRFFSVSANLFYSAAQGILDEKAAAVSALGTYALKCGAAFKPFIEPTLDVFTRLSTYFHEDVRMQAVLGMSYVFTATSKTFPSATANDPPTAQVAHVLSKAVETASKIIKQDEDKDVVAAACTCLNRLLCNGTRAALAPHLQAIAELTMELLKGKPLDALLPLSQVLTIEPMKAKGN